MRALFPCLLASMMAFAAPVLAQQAAHPVGAADCAADVAAMEQDMEVARSRGQMLRRQQLANQLATLKARCQSPNQEPGREARIAALEQEIKALQAQLSHAEEELRKLRHGTP